LTITHERLRKLLVAVEARVEGHLPFRFNNRTLTDSERFSDVIMHVVGRRLTYAELIAALDAGNAPA